MFQRQTVHAITKGERPQATSTTHPGPGGTWNCENIVLLQALRVASDVRTCYEKCYAMMPINASTLQGIAGQLNELCQEGSRAAVS